MTRFKRILSASMLIAALVALPACTSTHVTSGSLKSTADATVQDDKPKMELGVELEIQFSTKPKVLKPVEGSNDEADLPQGSATIAADPYVELYAVKGHPYQTIASHSHYHTPIVDNGEPRGNSRIWGDATNNVQRASIEAIRGAAKKAGMTLDQEAMVLAIAYVESGFNPDAAAGTTSAQGLGQFIRKTGEAYGLTDANRWDLNEQARALVEHTMDNYEAAHSAGLGAEYVYARHHDGSFTNEYGGLDLAVDHVVPKSVEIRRILANLESI